MSWIRRFEHRIRRLWFRKNVELWYHPAYRLPITSLGSITGFESRRADFVMWYVLDRKLIPEHRVIQPRRLPLRDLARVHDCSYLESLTRSETLAHIFGVESWDIPAEEVMNTMRLACGATVGAARNCLQYGGVGINVLGGFHHASPERGAGLCPLNDIAIAIACLRADGFSGHISILDLDAHPPDGLAQCVQDDPNVWIGSLSGADWGELPRVDETVLPEQTQDAEYLEALNALLERMPQSELAFVIAGGDVLANDKMGTLALTLDGARERDECVALALDAIPSVWLAGGGYHTDAWRVLAGTALYLSVSSKKPIHRKFDPLKLQFQKIALSLTSEELEGDSLLSAADLQEALGLPNTGGQRLLGFYTVDGSELAFYRYGLLDYIRRLGYSRFRVEHDQTSTGDRMRLFADAGGATHLLVEIVLEKKKILDDWMLYIHWLTLRHPQALFKSNRPALPGQEVPGLGLAKEASEMMDIMAKRLHLKGVAFQPAWFHIAFTLRRRFRFVSPELQGKFEALIRDVAHLPLHEATQLVAEHQVGLEGQPYHWQSDVMAFMAHPTEAYLQEVQEVRDRTHFVVHNPRE